MNQRVAQELAQERHTDFHAKLLDHVMSLVEFSRSRMAERYENWDYNRDIYRGRRELDEDDVKARRRGEPTKFIVPLTYSQVQTFIAFCFSLFLQRDHFFELQPVGPEDTEAARVAEALLDRDLEYNNWYSILYQFLLDIARYGIGILKTGWTLEKRTVIDWVDTQRVDLYGNVRTERIRMPVEKVVYEGNKIVCVSPYRFFPDPRLPVCRFQEGEFVASEDIYSRITLKRLERAGEIVGVDFIEELSEESAANRRLAPEEEDGLGLETSDIDRYFVLTEVQVELVPAEWILSDGQPLGPEDYPVKYNVWYVNDSRIVKVEPLGYPHGQFTYDVAEFSPDQHELLNDSLVDTIDHLQDVITWLINSHITNVRKVIGDKLVVDPSGIEMRDLKERRPVIRLKPDAARMGVDRFIKQLTTVDVTARHIADAQELQRMAQMATGITDNALGLFHTGRRSATEARQVFASASSRLKLYATMIFRNGLLPMARKMLDNLRAYLSHETLVRVTGESVEAPAFIRVQAEQLAGAYDFKVFDATLPSERIERAMALQEFLTALLQNPQAVQMLGYDIRKLVREWLILRGIRYPQRFEQEGLQAAAPAAPAGAGVPVAAPPVPGLGGAVPQGGAVGGAGGPEGAATA